MKSNFFSIYEHAKNSIVGNRGAGNENCEEHNVTALIKTRDNSIYYQSSDKSGIEPMYLRININGKHINFEIGTGTYATVISEKTYREYLNDTHITKTDGDLRAYGGRPLIPIGVLFDLKVKFDNKAIVGKCYVLPGTGPPLVGREWLAKFDWPLWLPNHNRTEVNKLDSGGREHILRKYATLFEDSPGTIA